MFFTKKKKIQKYLEQKAESDKNAFDFLLCNYLDGTLKTDLELLGITKNEIHIDWLDDIKCIGIQGRYKKYFADIQISLMNSAFHLIWTSLMTISHILLKVKSNCTVRFQKRLPC